MDHKNTLAFTPNEITQLTETFDEICVKNKLFFNDTSLGERLTSYGSGKRKKQNLKKWLESLDDSKKSLCPEEASFGLKYLSQVNSSEEVDGFCEVISFSRSDLAEILKEKNMLSTVAAYQAGVFVQNINEKKSRSQFVRQADEKLAKQCESLLSKKESYQMGKERTSRIWNDLELVKKRGKPTGNKELRRKSS